MANNIKKYLTTSVVKLLRPLVRILLRYGISYSEFAEMARWVFVNVAEKDFVIDGRKQTISRISVITGLNRKDVTRLTKTNIYEDKTTSAIINRAGRVIGGWVRDQNYHDHQGVPATLPLEGGKDSFTELVKRYSGDMPVRAVLDELLRIEAVKKNEDNSVCLLTRAYIPKNIDVEKITILGDDAADLMSTIDRNLDEQRNPFFQRKVVYDNIPSEAAIGFRETSAAEGQLLLEKLDVLLSGQDRDCNPAIEGSGRKRLGVGIFYFEEDISDNDDKKKTGLQRKTKLKGPAIK